MDARCGGTVDQVDWLVTESYSGVAAGLSRLYGSCVNIDEVVTPIGVVREGHRPTVHSFEPSEMATLQWLMWTAESPLDHTYYLLRNIAQTGHGPRSRGQCTCVAQRYDQVRSVDPQFAERHFRVYVSLSLPAVSLVAAAAETAVDFREGLLTRVVATFSCEDRRVGTPDGDCIVVGRDKEGNVTVSSTETRIGEPLTAIAARVDRHCASRGTNVKSDLKYEPIKRIIPDFVQSTSVEEYTPAGWVNLVDIKTARQPSVEE